MSTNFYVFDETKECAECERHGVWVHVAKNSAGWVPVLEMQNPDDTFKLVSERSLFKSEYGVLFDKEEFMSVLENHAVGGKRDTSLVTLINGWNAIQGEFS